MNTKRRRFIAGGIAATGCIVVPRLLAEAVASPEANKPRPAERVRPPPQDLALVLRFVQAGHVDLARVKAMLERDSITDY